MEVKDLKGNDVIYCSTLEENDQILDLFISLGKLWCSGKMYKEHGYYESKSYIETEGGVGYQPQEGTFTGVNYFKENNYNLIHASSFLNQVPTYEIY